MSDPTRYYPAGDGVVRTDPNGPLVNYHYYEELKAENARLKAEVEWLNDFCTITIIPNRELKAQIERLTKAGDAMAIALNLNDDVFDNHEKKLAQSAWNAAKEGKQP